MANALGWQMDLQVSVIANWGTFPHTNVPLQVTSGKCCQPSRHTQSSPDIRVRHQLSNWRYGANWPLHPVPLDSLNSYIHGLFQSHFFANTSYILSRYVCVISYSIHAPCVLVVTVSSLFFQFSNLILPDHWVLGRGEGGGVCNGKHF